MNWYEELFNQDYDRIYFPTFTTEKNSAEVDFIESALAIPKGGRILDVACGHGRHSIELAKRGYQVTGIDLSRRFIEMAIQSARSKALSQRGISDWRHAAITFRQPLRRSILLFH